MTSSDERRLRVLLVVALVLVGAGVWAFVLRGADGPEDPILEEPVGSAGDPSTTTTAPGTTTLPGEPGRVLLAGFDEVGVAIQPPDGSRLAWCVLAALTQPQRARGLMEVQDLQGYPGMVFVYQEDVQNPFYMRNTPMPLSIAWIAADGTVVSTADMEPCEDREGCPTYAPDGPYRYAIEVPRGRLEDLGITASSRVTVGGPCAPPS
jgi:uncharacterized membrane protein (UPF0127 family)